MCVNARMSFWPATQTICRGNDAYARSVIALFMLTPLFRQRPGSGYTAAAAAADDDDDDDDDEHVNVG